MFHAFMLAFSIFSGFLTIVLRVYMELVRFFDSFKMGKKKKAFTKTEFTGLII